VYVLAEAGRVDTPVGRVEPEVGRAEAEAGRVETPVGRTGMDRADVDAEDGRVDTLAVCTEAGRVYEVAVAEAGRVDTLAVRAEAEVDAKAEAGRVDTLLDADGTRMARPGRHCYCSPRHRMPSKFISEDSNARQGGNDVAGAPG
jgi:hypothetical protein